MSKSNNVVDGHRIEHFMEIENLNNPQLLLSIYPEQSEREKLEGYLIKLGMNIGQDYWYL